MAPAAWSGPVLVRGVQCPAARHKRRSRKRPFARKFPVNSFESMPRNRSARGNRHALPAQWTSVHDGRRLMQADDPQRRDYPGRRNPPAGYLLAVVGPLLAVLAAAALQRWAELDDLSLVFMLAVLIVAARTRTGPAVLTALLCFLAYNFFFIEPRYTLYIGARQGVATVALFLAAALLAGRLASRLAMQVQALQAANQDALTRQELGQRLAVAANEEEVVKAANEIFRKHLDAHER